MKGSSLTFKTLFQGCWPLSGVVHLKINTCHFETRRWAQARKKEKKRRQKKRKSEAGVSTLSKGQNKERAVRARHKERNVTPCPPRPGRKRPGRRHRPRAGARRSPSWATRCGHRQPPASWQSPASCPDGTRPFAPTTTAVAAAAHSVAPTAWSRRWQTPQRDWPTRRGCCCGVRCRHRPALLHLQRPSRPFDAAWRASPQKGRRRHPQRERGSALASPQRRWQMVWARRGKGEGGMRGRPDARNKRPPKAKRNGKTRGANT